jgi:DNA-binding PadR family transcriptional regulator
MSLPLALLGLLTVAELHGYDLKQLCDRVLTPGKSIKAGQVYSTLHRLERDGSIHVSAVERGEGPERRRYALTSRGRHELQQWLDGPEPAAPHLQSTLFMKVVVAILAGYSVERLIERQRSAHMQRMRELTSERRSAALSEVLLADFALFHLEADLRWLDLTAARLEKLRQQVAAGVAGIPRRSPEGMSKA